MKIVSVFALILVVTLTAAAAPVPGTDELPWSQRVANAAIDRWPDGRFVPPRASWARDHELGVLLQGMDAVWLNTVDRRYFNYIKHSMDPRVGPDGSIPTLKAEEPQLDDILLGGQLLLLYRITQDKRYLTAATELYEELQGQPRDADGGFWHKQRSPNQIWLDDAYLIEPFYAEYAFLSHHPEDFKNITRQFVRTSPRMGESSTFRARAMGWDMMALVDTLGYYPENDAGRAQLRAILDREAVAVARYQDVSTGLWHDVLDGHSAKSSYFESSAACTLVYALAKGVRLGYLPQHYLANAERGYQGILGHSVQARLESDPRDAGAFILASTEIENAANAKIGRGDSVMVDGWFNSQQRTDAFGRSVYFHYKWDTEDMPGYSLLGHIFRNYGAQTKSHYQKPTFENLRGAQVFLIASPDNAAKNPHPHFADAEDATQIAEWVKAGGVLMIMENDTSFADLDHFNLISEKFGIHFNSVLRKHVIGTEWEMGKIVVDGNGPIFRHPHTLFVKDVCTISVSGPAKPVLRDGDDILMAVAKYGKGTVFAFVDPWLYNEYTDGRKLPPTYDNYAAGEELVRWILEQVQQPL